jgi:hypothetical protein
MVNLLSNSSSGSITVPSDITQKDCLGRKEYFIKGTENLVNCIYIPITPTPSP